MSGHGESKPHDFARLGDLMIGSELLRGGGAPADSVSGASPSADGLARLVSIAWPTVVGEEIAANAKPVQIRQGRLVVAASSAAWAQTLQLMGEAIRGRLNELVEGEAVEQILFRHAGWEND
jgi:hypothetical protein